MRWSCLFATFVALFVQARPAPAQSVKETLQVIPEDAAGFFLLNRVEQTRVIPAAVLDGIGELMPKAKRRDAE
jgi:hypothetical protein